MLRICGRQAISEGLKVRVPPEEPDKSTTYRVNVSTLALACLAWRGIDIPSLHLSPEERARLARPRTVDPEAQELYLQGVQALGTGNPGNAISYFQKAIDKDPNYAQAHAALANSYGWMGEAFAWLEKSFVARDKGLTYLKIDPCLDPLRSDLCFQDLVRRVGLPS